MEIKYTSRDLLRRFGTGKIKVSEEVGAEKIKKGEAKEATSLSSLPDLDPTVEDTAKPILQKDYGGRRLTGTPYIAWIHDTRVKTGGAELSNQTLLNVGRKLGFEIYECYPDTFDRQKLIKAELLIINNFFFFEPKQYHFILDLLYEYKRPYVKYEHDHRELYGDLARPKLARILFGNSILNVFISPFQLENHRKRIGALVEPYYLLPPAIDTDRFKILDDIKREKNKVVNVTGRLYHSKGLRQIANFVHLKPKLKFEIYTVRHDEFNEYFTKSKNVKIKSVVPNHKLPAIYNSAEYTIHLPASYEACGRTIAEGLLCGCKPLLNENVGIRSFSYFHVGDANNFDREVFKRTIDEGLYAFWKVIEAKFNGLTPRVRVWERKEKGLIGSRRKRNENSV